MADSAHPVFEDIVRLDDGEVQRRLNRAPDPIIAASLQDAPVAVIVKVVKNLSARRRESVTAAAQRVPPRTVEVSRRVLTCLLFDLPDPEAEQTEAPDKGDKVDFVKLMQWLAENNPAIRQMQDERKQAIEMGVLRRLMGLDRA